MPFYEQPSASADTMTARDRDLLDAITLDAEFDEDRWEQRRWLDDTLDDYFDDYEDFGMGYRPEDEPDSDVPAGLYYMGQRPDNSTYYDLEATADYKQWELEQERLYNEQLEKKEADALALEEFAADVEAKFARRDASKHRLGQFGTHRVMMFESDEDKDMEEAKLASAAARKSFAKK